MALVSCRECGKSVSTQAASCPHCGCPVGAASTALPPAAAGTSPPGTPEQVTPVKWLRLKVHIGNHPLPKSMVRTKLTEIAYDSSPVYYNPEASGTGPAVFGPIPYAPGSHMVNVTALCSYGGGKNQFRTSNNFVLLLGELPNEMAFLDIRIDNDGRLGGVKIWPESCGYIRPA